MNLLDYANAAAKAVVALAPVAEELADAVGQPEIAAGIGIGAKLVQAAQSGETTAQALVTQIQSGTPPTADQLLSWEQDYEAAYATSQADLKQALADSAAATKTTT